MDFRRWRQRLESADTGLRRAAGYTREDRFSYTGLRCGLGGFMVRAGPAGSRQSPRRLHPELAQFVSPNLLGQGRARSGQFF